MSRNNLEAASQLQVRFPESGSVIESRGNGVPIPLVMDNAAYPILAIINGVEQRWMTVDQSSLKLTQRGSCSVALVDAKGQAASVSFVLR